MKSTMLDAMMVNDGLSLLWTPPVTWPGGSR
jgi:hypothetical protein